jgi:peptidoglycan/xylan/chitin deacetylase (PgdA/CDA1 family)
LSTARVAVITFDVEQDCPPYLNTFHGVEVGLPKILELLSRKRVKATMFLTARVAEKYPQLVRRIVDEGHELGCHGYNHERLDKLDLHTARRLVEKATMVLRRFASVESFRAPNLKLPSQLLPTLAENGYRVDSSIALYKPPFPRGPRVEYGIVRLPATVTSSVLRLPWRIQVRIHRRLPSLRIYFSHPWEYIDMHGRLQRYDCIFNTGRKALELLSKLIDYLRSEGFKLLTISEAARQVAAKLPEAQ